MGMIEPPVAISRGQVMRQQIASWGQRIRCRLIREVAGRTRMLVDIRQHGSVYLGKGLGMIAHTETRHGGGI
jgi:hypothetical protein